jgi:glutamate-1-semialdehyde 2,1-aminomutase
MNTKSEDLFKAAKEHIPGGVNSPVRAFKSVEMDPIYIARGKGSKVWDVDGNEYIDYLCSWGPLVLGHADDRIVKVLNEYAQKGTSFGANTEIEVKFARLITEIFPSIEKVRMVSSGTEAAMSAVRLARGYTKKSKIIKFEGCYHGHGDSFLIKAGSGVLTLGIPGSPGITENTASDTLIAEFNNIGSVEELVTANRGQIAAIILEPVMGNAGLIPPDIEFLKKLRTMTEEEDILLIFDEVITGFRVALGGAQQLYGIEADLTCLGKIIGGGLPVGAFGGRAEIMDHMAPDGPVYQAGTLSGNPLAMAIGYETVSILKKEKAHDDLEQKGALLVQGFEENMKDLGLSFTVNRVGSMFCLFFTDREVKSYEAAMSADTRLFQAYFSRMIENGIYIAPSPFEVAFLSTAHSQEDIERTVEANYLGLRHVKSL